MKVHERLRAYIIQNGIKQNHVASLSGISAGTFNNKLLGRGRISADEFEKICVFGLKVNPGIFFTDEVLKTKIGSGPNSAA